MHSIENDEKVKKYLGGSTGKSLAVYQKSIEDGQFTNLNIYAIEEKNTSSFIGYCSLNTSAISEINSVEPSSEIWCVLSITKQNVGYGKEILKKLIAVGFDDLKLKRIDAKTSNPYAMKINDCLGLKVVGQSEDKTIYSITLENYLEIKDQIYFD